MNVKMKSYTVKSVMYLFLVIMAVIALFPVVYTFFGALKDNMELLTSGRILPKKIIFDNYIYAFEKVNFGRYTLNSIFVTFVTVVLSLIIATMGGYAIERKDFPGKKIIEVIYVCSMFVSVGSATLYPVYKLCINMGINNSLSGLIFVGVGPQVFNIILVKGFIKGVDRGFDEAATIDGCGFFMIYVKIILPLIRPVIGVIALFSFVASWNSYLMPMILTSGNAAIKTLAVAVVDMKSNGEMATLWSVILAGANIAVVPVVIVYIFTSKQFISGLTLGGIKG